MTASSPNLPTRKHSGNDAGVIDVTPVVEDLGSQQPPAETSSAIVSATSASSGGGGLATTKGTFSAFLAPLNKDMFKEVVTDVEEKLRVVNQTLSMLELDTQSFDAILKEMLDSITLKTAELLSADRTTIFLLDEDKNELWSIVAEGEDGTPFELRIPADKGIAGEVATFKRVVNIPFDFYEDPRSKFAQIQDKKNGYRTYTMLTLPLLGELQENGEQDLVAVVQLINKLKLPDDPSGPLAERIDQGGFTEIDQQIFNDFAPSIRLILESSRSFYVATQKQRAATALMTATQSLSQSSLDLEETLNKVMDEAKKLMNADRSTLWLVDDNRGDLWTKIPGVGELRCPMGVGFAGQVAETGEPLIIPFDLYTHPNAENAKKTDQKSGYRTCSLLCMPVFNADKELIGVTQLLNKRKQGDFPAYDPENWPEAPEVWKASFNRSDQEFMQAFNIQAGVALQNAKLFATVKQQEQMQRDILRSLSNAVISTDKEGQIIAANESAQQLLGVGDSDPLEGKKLCDLVHIKESDFTAKFEAALEGTDPKAREQYYPDQTLMASGEDKHSVHLSINSIADARDATNVYGALVVMDDISDEKRLKSTMYRYMTPELAEVLISLDNTKLGGDRKEVSVLFSDIRGYTTLTENLEAEEVVKMLNEYFESMVEAIFHYKGTLDKYIGDAIMAVFGSPLPLEDHAWKAVQTAVEMRKRLVAFNANRARQHLPDIRVGIGINSDTVISGNIGSSRRMEFTAIGDGVNLGSRLEGASKQYGVDIVISENTYEACGDRVWARELDRIRVKGKNQPVSVYQLLGLRSDPLTEKQEEIVEHYHQGREYYLARDFDLAIAEFARVKKLNPHDKASSLHIQRCNRLMDQPPGADWDGVWTMTEK